MTWNLQSKKTLETIQRMKTELPQIDTVETALCIGHTDEFVKTLQNEFNMKTDIFTEDLVSAKFTTHVENGLISSPEECDYDLIYINGLKCRRNMPSIITWASKTEAKYIFVDKTQDEIVKERYYTYWYRTRKTKQTLFCHFKYENEQMQSQIITILKRFDI